MESNLKSNSDSIKNETKNVLVVDDNRNDLLMVKFVLLKMGFNPILLDKPRQVVDTLQMYKVSLIILDLEMPEINGIDVLRKIKRVDAYKNIPVVMLTGHSAFEDVKKAVSVGAIDYIIKPIDAGIFENKVNKIIKTDGLNTDWIEYEIKELSDSEVQLYFTSHLVSIGETSLTLKANQNLPNGTRIFTNIRLFEKLEIKNPALKVEHCEEKNGEFIINCTILGLSESDLKKIRLYQKLLSPAKAA